MPITKQAIKRMKQNETRRARNQHYKSRMKSMIKLVNELAKKKDVEKAKKTLPKAYSAIDTAAKKNLIHENYAARKKSQIQKVVDSLAGSKK